MAAFLRDYEQARGADLTAFELEEVAAAATYARAYNARCEHAIDPSARAGAVPRARTLGRTDPIPPRLALLELRRAAISKAFPSR